MLKNKVYINCFLKVFAITLLVLSLLSGFLTGCKDRFPSSFILELPEVPDSWVTLLGEPNWRLEWVNQGGQKQIVDYPPGGLSGIEIEIPVTWTNPVIAWPYWPAHNLMPNVFKPCGALFPFDVITAKKHSSRLQLSWEAGPDTVFFWEQTIALNQSVTNNTGVKIPVNFDWQRFRELFRSGTLSEAVCKDPWVINWRNMAEKTIESNFDRRRLVPEATELKHFTVPDGTWYGVSPFSKPLFFAEGEQPVFPVRPGLNVWVSAKGILMVNGNTWAFTEKREY